MYTTKIDIEHVLFPRLTRNLCRDLMEFTRPGTNCLCLMHCSVLFSATLLLLLSTPISLHPYTLILLYFVAISLSQPVIYMCICVWNDWWISHSCTPTRPITCITHTQNSTGRSGALPWGVFITQWTFMGLLTLILGATRFFYRILLSWWSFHRINTLRYFHIRWNRYDHS